MDVAHEVVTSLAATGAMISQATSSLGVKHCSMDHTALNTGLSVFSSGQAFCRKSQSDAPAQNLLKKGKGGTALHVRGVLRKKMRRGLGEE
jgi:hypothetical protein